MLVMMMLVVMVICNGYAHCDCYDDVGYCGYDSFALDYCCDDDGGADGDYGVDGYVDCDYCCYPDDTDDGDDWRW